MAIILHTYCDSNFTVVPTTYNSFMSYKSQCISGLKNATKPLYILLLCISNIDVIAIGKTKTKSIDHSFL